MVFGGISEVLTGVKIPRAHGVVLSNEKRLVLLNLRPCVGVLFIRVPFCVWDPKGDPKKENYPSVHLQNRHTGDDIS